MCRICYYWKYTNVYGFVAYRLASLANHSSCSSSCHLDVSLKFDFFLWPKEVLFLQFAIDSALSLEERANKRRLTLFNNQLFHQPGILCQTKEVNDYQ